MQRISRLVVILMFLFSFTDLGFSQSNSQKQEDNFYAEAANGLAEHAFEILESHKPRQIEEKKK